VRIVNFSVDHPVTVTVFYLALLALGIAGLGSIGIDMFPDNDYPVVAVMAEYPGTAPEEMEKLVTEHLESAAASVDGVRKVKAVSLQGVSALMVEFEWDADLNVGAQDIRNQVEMVLEELPEDIERPVVLKFDFDLLPVVYYGVYSTKDRDMRVMRKFVKDAVEKRLESLPGVSSAVVQGGLEREIVIACDREKLYSRNISLAQIARAVSDQNRDIPGGQVDEGRNELRVRVKGKYTSLDTIANTLLTQQDGAGVYVKDVATVLDSHKEIRQYSRTEHHPSVLLTVSKEPGGNTVEIVKRIKTEMADIEANLPPDIKIVHVYDTARLILGSISQLNLCAFFGFLCAVVILYSFLRSLRSTIILSLTIPFAILVALCAIYFADLTLNIMTLSGIALGIGLIVDNAIVVLENIFRHREMGMNGLDAAKRGAAEVGTAISASTLTTIVVFLPVALTGGLVGILTRPLGLTVVAALIASLVLALTLVPMMGARMISLRVTPRGDIFARLRNSYEAALVYALNNRGRFIFGGILLFVLGMVLLGAVGAEFIPKLDESDGTAVIKLEPGLSLKETDLFIRDMERVVSSLPEYESMISFVGRSESSTIDMVFGIAPSDVNEAEMYFKLKPKAARSRSFREICDEIYSRINLRDGVTVYFMDTLDWFLGGGERTVEVKLFGDDLMELSRLSGTIEEQLSQVTGLVDLDTSLKPGRPELQIHIDREKASRLGMTVGAIARTVDTAFIGEKAGKYRLWGEEYTIRVKYSKADRNDPDDVGSVTLHSLQGPCVYLRDVADISRQVGPAEIKREDQRRVVVFSANVSGRDTASVVRDVQQRLSGIKLPDGYFIKYGGGYEDMENMLWDMVMALVLVVLLVYLVMSAQFESFFQPLSIMFSVPLAVVGTAAMMWITGTTVSLMSLIGMLMVVGIVVNNAIVLIDYTNRLRRGGMSQKEAIIQAGRVRLRPIIMSSMTTIFALLPMIILGGEGYELFAPISVAMVGGLLTSTFLTLLVVPAWYSFLDEVAFRFRSGQGRAKSNGVG
jgi:HAE1 family hydrophobic/amphiphilic exporter-1